jgi:hypothetical protein
MGHYYADLMCNECGRVNCICPCKPEKPNKNWVVDSDYTVIQVHNFHKKYATIQTKYGPIPGMTVIMLMGKEQFNTRREAEEQARLMCEKAVELLRTELLALKKILNVDRPWEQK